MNQFFLRLWSLLISLKTAVTIIACLAASLMVATFVESIYDAKTAQYFVYRSIWFYGVLAALGLNILAVALSRYPWKPKHTPFLMAHAGILMILFGSALTFLKGIDGSMRLSEGEVSSSVELDTQILSVSRGDDSKTIPVPWIPTQLEQSFDPIVLQDLGVQVDRFIADSEVKVSFEAAQNLKDAATSEKIGSAIQIRILGSPMGGAPEFWLWTGDAGWMSQKLGPARFLIRQEHQNDLGLDLKDPEARLDFVVDAKGQLRFESRSIRGEKKSAVISTDAVEKKTDPVIVNPGWKMPIQVQVKKFIRYAVNKTQFKSASIKSGMGGSVPISAIRLSMLANPELNLWLGLGDRAELTLPNQENVSMGYYPKRIILPFALRLKKFEVQNDPGTQNPAAYASDVQLVTEFKKDDAALDLLPSHNISMNEPMKHSLYTFYQASFIPDFPRPTTTVLSVNYDPGRSLKYWGSLLLVLGSVLLFVMKSINTKRMKS
jgi:hypothetical protein